MRLLFIPRGLSQGFFDRPIEFIKSTCNGSSVDAGYSRPFHKGVCLAIKCYKSIICSVIGLLNIQRPATVIGCIIPVIIDSIKSIRGGWFFSHIIEKCLKRITPAITNFYTACAIMFIRKYVRIITTAFHSKPHFMHWGSPFTVSFISSFHYYKYTQNNTFKQGEYFAG